MCGGENTPVEYNTECFCKLSTFYYLKLEITISRVHANSA